MLASKPIEKPAHNLLVKPVVKWVGGKRQLMSDIKRHLPENFNSYYEPFIGGGAVLFNIQPSKAFISDTNAELINLYRVIRDTPQELLKDLQTHLNEEEYFYDLRSKDRNEDIWNRMTEIQRASRLIFLNKTCFNGLYRVNNSGEFNAPFGRYKNPRIADDVTINAVSKYFNSSDTKILHGDYQAAVTTAQKGDFVYFDPPYDPVSQSANFTGYTSGGFDRTEQTRLKEVCDHLTKKNVHILVSNSATDFIKTLYSSNKYKVSEIKARRAINSNGKDRGEVAEVLISNNVDN